MGKSKYRLPKYDVSWYAPNRKRPIAYSCEWVMFSLAYEAEDSDETVQQLRDRLNGQGYIPNDEVNVVLDAYIKYGYGDAPADKIFYR